MVAMYDFPVTTTLHTSFVHPEYQYWKRHWDMIRDSVVGEVQIKRKNELYLAKLENMTKDEYAAFLDRAVFFNMTQRTIIGMMGSLFRRNPIIESMPKNLQTEKVSKQGQTLGQFVKEAATEVITMGRYGVLLDMDEKGVRPPYFAGYIAENIVDWTVEEIDGRFTVTEVILRELRLARPLLNPLSVTPAGQQLPKTTRLRKGQEARVFSQDTTVTRAARRWLASYRVLRLEHEVKDDPTTPRIYRQYYHTSDHGDASPEGTPYAEYTPTWRGKPFSFIPFKFLGPYDNTPDIPKSPLMDIVLLNHSHYKSYAMLEHGRFYTALPVYYAEVRPGEENANYTVGPSVVWEMDQGSKAGIIEFHGGGLKYLENACNAKEDQIAALGGRLVGVERVATGESNNMLKMKESNEAALLLNVANVLDVTFTDLLQWWAQWQDTDVTIANKIKFKTNKDFLISQEGAREFRAIQMMYENGVIPVEVLFDYLKRAEVVPDYMDIDLFKDLLMNANSFPNMADVKARQRGAPNAATEWEYEHVLTSPDVVAVRGFDSQSPLGQQPLPGQIPIGPVSVTPIPKSTPTGPGGGKAQTTGAPGPAINPVNKLGPMVPENITGTPTPSPIVPTANGSTEQGLTDVGNQNPNSTLTQPNDKRPRSQDRGAGVTGDLTQQSTSVVTI